MRLPDHPMIEFEYIKERVTHEITLLFPHQMNELIVAHFIVFLSPATMAEFRHWIDQLDHHMITELTVLNVFQILML